ncbi:hypothetical protein HWV62_10751, partial [Athelia sp. TMB]
MAESNGVDAIRSILHERSKHLIRARVITEAECLALEGHVPLANDLLGSLFTLLKPIWPGNTLRVSKLGWEYMWLDSQSRPVNAPIAHLPLPDIKQHRLMFYASIGVSSRSSLNQTTELARQWRDVIVALLEHADSPPSELRAKLGPKLERLNRRFPPRPTSPLDVEDTDIYPSFVCAYLDYLIRVGDLDTARTILNNRVRLICRKCVVMRHQALCIPEIYTLLQDDDPETFGEVAGSIYALIAALNIRIKDGVARPYADLSWSELIERYLVSAKKRYPVAIGRLSDPGASNTPVRKPASDEDIAAMISRLALDTPIPADYIDFLRYSNGIKGVHPSHVLGSAAQVRVETWTGVSKLRVECDEQDLISNYEDYEDWPVLKRVVAIDASLSNAGDIWLVEPWLMAQARQFGIDARKRKQAREEGAPTPPLGESPLSCPKPKGKDAGFVFQPPTHEASNLPTEIIDIIVKYALRDISGFAYDRDAALALCSTSRRMHE